MSVYAFWNNKGGVGKSYLTFQVACEYARTHPDQKILVIDLCPQANASGMLLGGIIKGERTLVDFAEATTRKTIAGYIEERIRSPYVSPKVGSKYVTQVSQHNKEVPANVFLVVGDEALEIQASRVANATNPGPTDAWRLVHTWISDLITEVHRSWNANGIPFSSIATPAFPSTRNWRCPPLIALSFPFRLTVRLSARCGPFLRCSTAWRE